MPMIDIYAVAGTFADIKNLSTDAAALVKSVEEVPDIPMFRKNTAAFVHEMPPAAMSNVDGDSNYVRIQILTNAGALNRDKHVSLPGPTARSNSRRPRIRGASFSRGNRTTSA
jgi:hypothetical protein